MTSDTDSTSGLPDSSVESSSSDEANAGEEKKSAPLNPLQVISSVFAAGLGVQSSKNRERDFKQGRIGTFIFTGLLFTALFIGTVYTVVSLVLSSR
ncbi:DUF2970 domain-containing protein [Congregibacter sp.]|jgi:hypothetical protein|uniref:DUF2970 domain-containing protein n=1 Tax=Congregibacter sp. TaxID=2744308 RepID=UPI0039E406AB